MTALTLNTVPRRKARESKLQRFIAMLARALDAYANYRVQRAVSEFELRQANRTIKRCGRLLNKTSVQSRKHAATQVTRRGEGVSP